VRYGELRSHERVLDFRDGVLRRAVEWVSPTGRIVRISSTRLVSFTQRGVAAIVYEVEPLDGPVAVVAQSELVANESLPGPSGDPRQASTVGPALRSEFFADRDAEVLLVHSTEHSGLRLGAAMDHIVNGPGGAELKAESFADLGRVTVSAKVAPGSPLGVVKLIAYGWSARRSIPAVRDQVAAALGEARYTADASHVHAAAWAGAGNHALRRARHGDQRASGDPPPSRAARRRGSAPAARASTRQPRTRDRCRRHGPVGRVTRLLGWLARMLGCPFDLDARPAPTVNFTSAR
jgi:trehalose/maltose hydrolase-like predicted phosphorylase